MENYFISKNNKKIDKKIDKDWYGIIHFVCNLEKHFVHTLSAEYN